MLCLLSFRQVQENSRVLKPKEESLISVSPEDTNTPDYKSCVIIDIYWRVAVWRVWRCCVSFYIIKCPKGADEQHHCFVRKAKLPNTVYTALKSTHGVFIVPNRMNNLIKENSISLVKAKKSTQSHAMLLWETNRNIITTEKIFCR